METIELQRMTLVLQKRLHKELLEHGILPHDAVVEMVGEDMIAEAKLAIYGRERVTQIEYPAVPWWLQWLFPMRTVTIAARQFFPEVVSMKHVEHIRVEDTEPRKDRQGQDRRRAEGRGWEPGSSSREDLQR